MGITPVVVLLQATATLQTPAIIARVPNNLLVSDGKFGID